MKRFLRQLGIFCLLKLKEIFTPIANVAVALFEEVCLNRGMLLKLLFFYLLGHGLFFGSYHAEVKWGWTWQYYAFGLIKSIDEGNEAWPYHFFIENEIDKKDEEATHVDDLGWATIAVVLVVVVPFIGYVFLLSVIAPPFLAFIIVFGGFLGGRALFRWLRANWIEAGRIADGRESR